MNRKHREMFLMEAVRLGLNDYTARKVTRLAATHDRLSEAECNGDWPCDNGERPVIFCGRCGAGYHRSATYQAAEGRICKNCRTQDLILAALADCPTVAVEFQGDPRGWTVKLSKAEAAS